MTLRNKGDRQAQNRRKRKRKEIPRTKNEYHCIDGNMTVHPVAYCTHYHGVLTQGLMETHHCLERQCVRLRLGDSFE